MEPTILISGRLQSTLDVLAEELSRSGRKVLALVDRKEIEHQLRSGPVDFVAIGAGLPDEVRDEIVSFMRTVNPDIPIQLLQRTPDASPAKFIHFVNDLAILFKVQTAAGIKPFSKRAGS